MIVRSRALLLWLCFSFFCLVFPARAQNLPDSITSIQVDVIQASSGEIQKVLVTDLLVGKDAQQFVARWNSLKHISGKAESSPHPVYRLWFYQNKATLYRCAAICFDCHAIFALTLENPDHLGKGVLFQDNDASRQLRQILADLLPGHDPAPTSSR